MFDINKLKERTTRNKVTNRSLPSVIYPQDAQIKIFDLSYDIDADKLVKDIFAFKEKYPKSMFEYNRSGTYVHAWHSDFQTQKMTDIFDELIRVKKQKIEKYFGYKSFLLEIWANVYSTGDKAVRHGHGTIGFSTVYYPYVQDNPATLIFDNNNPNKLEKITITPEKNMLVIFPSFLHHKVSKVEETSRVSVAANFFPEVNYTDRDPFSFQDFPSETPDQL